MKIGIVGLGLIGGSIAKAIKQSTENIVYGTDIIEPVIYKAKLMEAIDDKLDEKILGECDMLIIALYPGQTIKYIEENGHLFKKGAMVFDCCGVKEIICTQVEPIAEKNGFVFIGAHPMAGIQFSGFEHSQKTLFRNAAMVLTPPTGMDIHIVDRIKKFWLSLGFTDIQIASPKEHDKIIAFTSQLAHIVSSAYVKSPTAAFYKGFSAGSFKDLTRVAKLNEDMWTELFLLNKENLASEIGEIIERLKEFHTVLQNEDEKELWKLLKEGTDKKNSIDGGLE